MFCWFIIFKSGRKNIRSEQYTYIDEYFKIDFVSLYENIYGYSSVYQ
jgi:hypothetical protein